MNRNRNIEYSEAASTGGCADWSAPIDSLSDLNALHSGPLRFWTGDARAKTVSELAVSVPLQLFVLDTVCVEFRISTDSAHGNSRGSSLHKRYGGQ
jgi:hypothetical protein